MSSRHPNRVPEDGRKGDENQEGGEPIQHTHRGMYEEAGHTQLRRRPRRDEEMLGRMESEEEVN